MELYDQGPATAVLDFTCDFHDAHLVDRRRGTVRRDDPSVDDTVDQDAAHGADNARHLDQQHAA
jgi:hypothetical protein